MPRRALLYRRPSEPQAIEIIFDRAIYLGSPAPAPPGASLYAAHPIGDAARSILTIPPRGTLKEAREFAQKHGGWIAARLDRLPKAAPFADGIVVPLRGVPHRIAHRGPMRGTVWTEVGADGERLICVAGGAPHLDRRVGDFLRREAKRDLEIASRHFANELGVAVKRVAVRDQSSRWGSCSTTGRTIVFVAAHSGAEPRARLPCRARGRASRRNESLATVLASGAATVPGP